MKDFKCPDCGWTVLEEVMDDCTVTSEIASIYPITDKSGETTGAYVEYGDQETTYGFVERYQCQNCGWVLVDVKNEEDLLEFLENQE